MEFKSFLQRWIITTLAVVLAAHVLDGIHYDNVGGLLAATLLLGLLNAFVRPVMMLLSLPLLLFTLGLFTIVINAVLLYLVGQMKSFHVDTFGAALKGALLIGLISTVLSILTGTNKAKVRVQAGRRKPPGGDAAGPRDGGQIIDV